MGWLYRLYVYIYIYTWFMLNHMIGFYVPIYVYIYLYIYTYIYIVGMWSFHVICHSSHWYAQFLCRRLIFFIQRVRASSTTVLGMMTVPVFIIHVVNKRIWFTHTYPHCFVLIHKYISIHHHLRSHLYVFTNTQCSSMFLRRFRRLHIEKSYLGGGPLRCDGKFLPSLPLTQQLKMDGLKTRFLLGWLPLVAGSVECRHSKIVPKEVLYTIILFWK